jgi:hypothetical protein
MAQGRDKKGQFASTSGGSSGGGMKFSQNLPAPPGGGTPSPKSLAAKKAFSAELKANPRLTKSGNKVRKPSSAAKAKKRKSDADYWSKRPRKMTAAKRPRGPMPD